jgi:small subunit ribosomal protein S2
MAPYIFGKRNLIHIINVKETVKGLLLGKRFLAQTVANGKDVLIVGTKRQARKAVEDNAERVGMHCVSNRWLGGTLTNFHEIRKRVGRLEELEKMEAEGLLDAYSKKEGSSLRREMRKISRNLSGIRKMTRLPGAMVVIDQKREINAIREANKLGIPVVCLLDTECDPDLVDIPIPGNDDAMRAIQIIVGELCDAIEQGLGLRQKQQEDRPPSQVARPRSRRRPMGSAEAPRGDADAPQRAPAPAEQVAPTEQVGGDEAGGEQPAQG